MSGKLVDSIIVKADSVMENTSLDNNIRFTALIILPDREHQEIVKD